MTDVLRAGARLRDASLVAVMLHGRNRPGHEMLRLGESFDCEELHVLCPLAPGGSWYPQGFTAPRDANEPHLSRSIERIETLIEELHATGFGAERVMLCGFSQGACLAADLLWRRPRRFAGAMILSGALTGPEGTAWPARGSLAGMPVLLSGCENDARVPLWRLAETEMVFRALGADLRLLQHQDRPHVVSAEEADQARALVHEVLSGQFGAAGQQNRASGG